MSNQNHGEVPQSSSHLGFDEAAQAKLESVLGSAGSVAVGGPTGSGKVSYMLEMLKSMNDGSQRKHGRQMEQDKVHPVMRPVGAAGKVFQRKLDLEHDVRRLKTVVASIQRKLDGGSHAVTVEDLAARQRELLLAQEALASVTEEFTASAL